MATKLTEQTLANTVKKVEARISTPIKKKENSEAIEAPVEDIKTNITKPSIESEIKIKGETRETKNERNNENKSKGSDEEIRGEARGTRNNEAPNRRKAERRTSGGKPPTVPEKRRGYFDWASDGGEGARKDK